MNTFCQLQVLNTKDWKVELFLIHNKDIHIMDNKKKQTQDLLDFINQHNINVVRSLYTNGDDDNPIQEEDSVKTVSHKMGFGVRQDCHPELLSTEIKAIDWALDNGHIKDQWPTEIVMCKELEAFTQTNTIHISYEQLAESLGIEEEDVCNRMDTLMGLRMVWVGGVIRTLAIAAYREAFSVKSVTIVRMKNE